METYKKVRLQLLLILGSVVTAVMYINNPMIDTISFRGAIYRFLPFLSEYNPVTISLIFIIGCFGIAFLLSGKSIPKQSHNIPQNQSSNVKPIIQPIIIKPIVEQPRKSSGPVIEQPTKTHHTSKQKKPIIYNFWDRRNRKRFHW